MIALTLIGAVGVFVRLRYAYEARMIEHDRRRAEAAAPAPNLRRRAPDDRAGQPVRHRLTVRHRKSTSLDLPRSGLIIAPVIVAVCRCSIWGVDGAWSSALRRSPS